MSTEQEFEIHHDMLNEEYHAAPGISSTGLKEIRKSPAHYQAFKNKKFEQTESMRIGELIHLALFEYSRYKDRVVVIPQKTRKDSKAYEALVTENPGKALIKEDEASMISGVIESIMAHSLARELFLGGKPEVSVFAKCPLTGVQRKVRPDYLREDDVIVDLKTTKDARLNSFQRDASAYKYHLSAAYYLDTVNLTQPAVKKEQFVLVAVEKEPPYSVTVYPFDPEALARGRQLYEEALAKYKWCVENNEWPGYGFDYEAREYKMINLPLTPWAFTEE